MLDINHQRKEYLDSAVDGMNLKANLLKDNSGDTFEWKLNALMTWLRR